MKQDPVRLLDDLQVSGTMRDDLRVAQADPGPRYDVDAEAQRFSTLIASGGTGAASTAAAAARAGAKAFPFGAKVVTIAMVGLLGGAVTLKMLSGSSTDVPAGATPSAISTLERQPLLPVSDQPSTVAETGVFAADARAELPVKAKPTTANVARRVSPRGRTVVSVPARAPSEAAKISEASETTKPSEAAKPADRDSSALKEEMSQLAEIRSSARANPARAVDMVRQGHARFAHGVFWQERELLAITSLVALGRHDEARLRATAVLKQYPESPSAETLRRVIQRP